MDLPDVGSPVLPGDRVVAYDHDDGVWKHIGIAQGTIGGMTSYVRDVGGVHVNGWPASQIAPDYCPVRQETTEATKEG